MSNVKGTTLLKACTGPKSESCDAYVDGFGDAISAGGKDHALACLPIAATGTELRDVLVKFLKDHPEGPTPQSQHPRHPRLREGLPLQQVMLERFRVWLCKGQGLCPWTPLGSKRIRLLPPDPRDWKARRRGHNRRVDRTRESCPLLLAFQ